MALIVTVAGTTSESYASVAECDAYVVQVPSSTWDELGDGAKENYLRRATRLIDRYRWASHKYDYWTVAAGQAPGQRLQFPRGIDIDGNGSPYLPREVVEACCAIAVALSEGVTESGSSAGTIKRMKAGPVEIEYDTSDGTSVVATSADDIVRDLLGHRMATSVRAI